MKTILITGGSGMLGATLVRSWSKKYNVYATGGREFTDNPIQKYKSFNLIQSSYKILSDWVNPDYIIHCAALTNHEYCQKFPDNFE